MPTSKISEVSAKVRTTPPYAKAGYSLLIVASIIVFLLTGTLLFCGYIEAWHVPYFEQRYASTIAVAHGQPIYQVGVTGPLFCSIYGPLSYLAFLPAALLPTIQSVFAAGSLLATVFLALPLAFASHLFVRKYQLRARDFGPVLLVAMAALASLRPLNYIASHVTADAPAICFIALSILVLYRDLYNPRWTTAVLSGFFLVLGVGCKQNMLFAGLIILAGVFLHFARRFAYSYLVTAATLSVLGLGLVLGVHHDLSAVLFNDVVIPSRMPLVKANLFPGAYRMYENTILLVLVLTGLGLIAFLTTGSLTKLRTVPRFILVFFGISVVLCPLSIRIYAAAGGDVNDFSHAVYFLLLGVVITAFELLVMMRGKPQGTTAARILLTMGALTFFGSELPTRYTPHWKQQMRRTPCSIQAYDYSKLHPDDVYFPFNTIGVYMAEHKFYHADWGVMIRLLARQTTTREDIFKYIPQSARYVAIPKDYIEGAPGAVMPFVAPHHLSANLEGLSSFEVFLIER